MIIRGVDDMRNVIITAVVLLLAAGGCITINTGGGGSPPRVVSFSASPNSINAGDVSIISWQVENASSVRIDPDIPSASSTGMDKVVPMVTTTYRLTATNGSGTTTATTVVTVGATGGATPAPSGTSGIPVITSFTASPTSINAGDSSVLSWITTDATGATISGIGNVAVSGNQVVYPTATTTYILEATNSYNSTAASATVGVVPASTPPSSGSPPVILSFTGSISPATGLVTLDWSTLNATAATISDGIRPQPVNTSGSVTLGGYTGSTTFTLTANNSYGSSHAATTVVISGGATAPPPAGSRPTILSFTGSASASTGLVTLNWSTLNATSATISDGTWSQPVNTSDSLTFSGGGGGSTTYILTATNSYGDSTATTNVFIPGVSTPPAPTGSIPTASLSVSPSRIAPGGEATLSWVTSGATYSDISDGAATMILAEPSGSIAVVPTTTTTYILTARNVYGSNYASQTVTVTSATVPYIPFIPPAFPTIKFKADATTVLRGAIVRLSWSVTDADTISIDNSIGTVSATGSMDVTVWDTITYTLTASNMSNISSQSVTIKVP